MTEEIIIDGVDVSGCKHLKYDDIKKPICKSGGCTGVYKSCLCEDNLDCYYKQLKRTQKEIEKYSAINEQETKDYAELKKENEQLKEENKHYKQIAQHHGDMSIKYTNKCAKYKQILQDIKTLVTTDYIQIKRQLVQNYDCLDNFMQKIEEKCGEVM